MCNSWENKLLLFQASPLKSLPVAPVRLSNSTVTHWGRVTHICVGKLTIIGSDNGLSPGRRQPIIWTNAGILLIEPLGTNSSEIVIGIQILSFKKMRLKMSSAEWGPFCLGLNVLTHWGRLTHICVSKVTIIVSDNGVSPGRHQAIIWNNAGILLLESLGTNFSGIVIEIHTFSFKKIHLKMSSGKWRPFCLGLNLLMYAVLPMDEHRNDMGTCNTLSHDYCDVITNYIIFTSGKNQMFAKKWCGLLH